jgi:hypothetical protein
LDENGMEKKKARFGQAIVTDGIAIISPNHNLDAFQLLQLQWSIKTFTLLRLEPPHQRRGKRANLKLVEFCVVEHPVLVGIAELEYSTERFYACRLERLTSKVRPILSGVGEVGRLQTCFFESYKGAVG